MPCYCNAIRVGLVRSLGFEWEVKEDRRGKRMVFMSKTERGHTGTGIGQEILECTHFDTSSIFPL